MGTIRHGPIPVLKKRLHVFALSIFTVNNQQPIALDPCRAACRDARADKRLCAREVVAVEFREVPRVSSFYSCGDAVWGGVRRGSVVLVDC